MDDWRRLAMYVIQYVRGLKRPFQDRFFFNTVAWLLQQVVFQVFPPDIFHDDVEPSR